ncbi:DUF397 domain-containing protein [Actinocorallia sp. API 0066]|uniref:DUF397 domain-containing protein n=1 Tax=Actinocorallia sp. API 0066 TaxID=2896846 RepID=UPI001E614F6B|nr:DUF397 domain-containing protein [Actinocorallia sp. API 0066]MCD0448545.1 DUF397 domain-containing protein [Actinocorallia sp. API 0066]
MNPSARAWRKSSYSSGTGQCVEATSLSSCIGVRDSKHTELPHLNVSRRTFRTFLRGVKAGRHGDDMA